MEHEHRLRRGGGADRRRRPGARHARRRRRVPNRDRGPPRRGIRRAGELEGKRLALGSRDSGHAAILPLHCIPRSSTPREPELVRFDTDLGKHGDTGDSELRVVEAVARGDADAGALGDATWVALRTEGHPAVAELELAWRSPIYYHCNFTALPGFDGRRLERGAPRDEYDDPTLRPAMDLEGVKRWLPADKTATRP